MIRYGFIMAAGNQTRFKSSIPKALVDFNGKCLLDHNIEILKKICDNVFVVCSENNNVYFSNKYNKIVVKSGYGSGDALFKAIHDFDFSSDDQIVVCWGDTILNDILVLKLNIDTNCSVIPCCIEDNPYVQFLFNDDGIKVLFSKYGDNTTKGYHDMSIFLFNASNLMRELTVFIMKHLNKDGNYDCNGGEFDLLELYNNGFDGVLLEIDKEYTSMSFNTLEELNSLQFGRL